MLSTLSKPVVLVIAVVVLSVVAVLVYVGYRALLKNERYQALQKLCRLSPQAIDAYFDSYGKIFEDNSMVSTLADYRAGKPASRFAIKDNPDKQAEYTEDCYNVLNLLCALGNVKKMYIPKCIDPSKSLQANQNLQEEELAQRLHAPSDGTGRLLELGCGCGRIAHHIAQVTNCHVTGVNIDESQLTDARQFARDTGTSTQLRFVYADFNEPLPFADESFDGVYSIDGFASFINNQPLVFRDIYRVLKPNGRLAFTDAAILDHFNRNDHRHMRLLAKSRPLMGGCNFIHYNYFNDFATNAGFSIALSEGGAPDSRGAPTASELPMLIHEHAHFDMLEKLVYVCTCLRVLPAYMPDLMARLRDGGDDLVTMEREGLISMTWDFVYVKPEV